MQMLLQDHLFAKFAIVPLAKARHAAKVKLG